MGSANRVRAGQIWLQTRAQHLVGCCKGDGADAYHDQFYTMLELLESGLEYGPFW
jgi:hypothetical protein